MIAALWRVAVLAALGAVVCTAPAAAVDVPFLTGRVVDHAEILKAETRERIARDLKALEDRTTHQVAVLTVPTLDGESVEDYAVRVFESWKLGRKGRDNGVLVLVVPNDRRMRIEVGYGLEGTLTDAQAARVIRDRMTPAFKAGDFDRGVSEGVSAIATVLDGGELPAAPASGSVGDAASGLAALEADLPPWPMRILLGAFIFGIIGVFTAIGIVTPGMGWFLYFFLIPFWAMFPIVVVGVKGALALLTIYVVGFPVAKLIVSRRPEYARAAAELRRTGRATYGGMVITSGGANSGGSSSSSGGGGFSGGGGSSGGGGASGSW